MAGEIRIIETPYTSPRDVRVLFVWSIPVGSRSTYVKGDGTTATVVPCPSANLSADTLRLLSAAEITALDAGQALVEEREVSLDNPTDIPLSTANLKTQYGVWLPDVQARYAARYKYTGSKIAYP